MSLFANVPRWIREAPGYLKTREMCDEAVRVEPFSLEFVPDCLKTEDVHRGSEQQGIHAEVCS